MSGGILLALAILGLFARPAPLGLAPEEVGRAIAVRRERVPEFRLIREAARELGLRAWLFGGTAAAFAHYVRWDLAREAGDGRYRESFFDYDFTSIYRSTQDADLVVDATPEQAEALEGLIRQKLAFLQGSKEHWEVRLLRQDRTASGGQVKQALLHNPDFLGQNTDSNSTGMVELTDPPPGQGVVRDLRDWESSQPFFLQDVTDGRLHYYASGTHQQTSRYRSGDNPPLFSVIRYLVKAFQYELAVDGEDLAQIREVIDAFDPRRDYQALSPWAKGWLERYGPNLIRHSVDVEYAWNTLQELGLRGKLISLSRSTEQGSLAWWLAREPLRTGPVGKGSGPTARELGLGVVAHETGDFLAYESITRDTTLRPNVLVSRPGQVGEAATYGTGFYTRRGRAGARGTGLTIRFTVDPEAREGADFTVQGDFVVFTNRAALRVIAESLDLSTLEYFRMLSAGSSVDPTDRGVWMKLKRRLRLRPIAPEEEEPLLALVSKAIDEAARLEHELPSPVIGEWFALEASHGHPEMVEQLQKAVSARLDLGPDRDAVRSETFYALLRQWLARPEAREHPELIERMTQRLGFQVFLIQNVLTRPEWAEHPELVLALLRAGIPDHLIAKDLLPRKEWARYPDLLRILIERNRCDYRSLLDLMKLPQWHDPELARLLLDPGPASQASTLLADPSWADHPELLLYVIAREGPFQERSSLDTGLLRHEHWAEHPTLRELCGGEAPTARCLWLALHPPSDGDKPLSAAEEAAMAARVSRAIEETIEQGAVLPPRLLREWLARRESLDHPELVEKMLEWRGFDLFLASEVLGMPGWSEHPELVLELIQEGSVDEVIAHQVLSRREWSRHPGLLKALIKKDHFNLAPILDLFTLPHWGDPELARFFIRSAPALRGDALLAHPRWVDHPELVLELIAQAGPITGKSAFDYGMLHLEHWRNHPLLRQICGGESPTAACLWRAIQARAPAQEATEALRHLISGPPSDCSLAGGTGP